MITPDDVSVVAPEGGVRSKVKAYYSGDMFVIEDMSVDIRAGDEIRRRLPNGRDEIFLVEDPKLFSVFHGIPQHYQVKVLRSKPTSVRERGQNITVSGANARVNINSTDNSFNSTSETTLYAEIRKTIEAGVLDQAERAAILAALSELQKANTHSGFKAARQHLVSAAADYLTLLTPFLPSLAALLAQMPHG
jgi:hypothetical protein